VEVAHYVIASLVQFWMSGMNLEIQYFFGANVERAGCYLSIQELPAGV